MASTENNVEVNDFMNRIEGIDALPTLQIAVALDPFKKLTFLLKSNEKQYGQHCQMHSEPSMIENSERDVQQKKEQ